ncbi:hypothetical protein LCGC14_0999530 [marine sediment metagenome]|uniref:Uncharacterized protein n=1 Tax=marine sediment metagenome TaxID=412755 RepID=A0A0F9R9L7_9ZZZZ
MIVSIDIQNVIEAELYVKPKVFHERWRSVTATALYAMPRSD